MHGDDYSMNNDEKSEYVIEEKVGALLFHGALVANSHAAYEGE